MIIDLSENNGFVDYAKLKAAGVTAAILKVCPGVGRIDRCLSRNAVGLAAVGIAVSYYHVIHPDKRGDVAIEVDALAESNYFLDAIKNLPPYVRLWADIEDWDSKGTDTPLSKDDCQKWLKIYLDNIKTREGRDAGIYTYRAYFDTHFPDKHIFGGYKLWIANYGTTQQPPLPKGFTNYHMWQYSCTGVVDGVKTKVDLNRLK